MFNELGSLCFQLRQCLPEHADLRADKKEDAENNKEHGEYCQHDGQHTVELPPRQKIDHRVEKNSEDHRKYQRHKNIRADVKNKKESHDSQQHLGDLCIKR